MPLNPIFKNIRNSNIYMLYHNLWTNWSLETFKNQLPKIPRLKSHWTSSVQTHLDGSGLGKFSHSTAFLLVPTCRSYQAQSRKTLITRKLHLIWASKLLKWTHRWGQHWWCNKLNDYLWCRHPWWVPIQFPAAAPFPLGSLLRLLGKQQQMVPGHGGFILSNSSNSKCCMFEESSKGEAWYRHVQGVFLTHRDEMPVVFQHHIPVEGLLSGVQLLPLLLAEVHTDVLEWHRPL